MTYPLWALATAELTVGSQYIVRPFAGHEMEGLVCQSLHQEGSQQHITLLMLSIAGYIRRDIRHSREEQEAMHVSTHEHMASYCVRIT